MSNKKRVLAIAALTVIPLCAIPAAANATSPHEAAPTAAPAVADANIDATNSTDIVVTNTVGQAIWVGKSLNGSVTAKATELQELLPGETKVWHRDTQPWRQETTLLVFSSGDQQQVMLKLDAHDFTTSGASQPWMHPSVTYRTDAGIEERSADTMPFSGQAAWDTRGTEAKGSYGFAAYNLGGAESTVASFNIKAMPQVPLK